MAIFNYTILHQSKVISFNFKRINLFKHFLLQKLLSLNYLFYFQYYSDFFLNIYFATMNFQIYYFKFQIDLQILIQAYFPLLQINIIVFKFFVRNHDLKHLKQFSIFIKTFTYHLQLVLLFRLFRLHILNIFHIRNQLKSTLEQLI